MKFKTINVSQSIETYTSIGLKKWNKIDVGIELDDTDNPDNAYEAAVNKVQEWHKKSGAIVEVNYAAIPEVQIEKPHPKQSALERTIQEINNCKDIVELFTFKKLANSQPEIKAAYTKREQELKQLSNE